MFPVNPPGATFWQSGETARREMKTSTCPSIVGLAGASKFQSRSLRSTPADKTWRPSGNKAVAIANESGTATEKPSRPASQKKDNFFHSTTYKVSVENRFAIFMKSEGGPGKPKLLGPGHSQRTR
jgi:hypothetical protein